MKLINELFFSKPANFHASDRLGRNFPTDKIVQKKGKTFFLFSCEELK